MHLEELENIKSLRPGNAGDIERFADLLDVTVLNVKEANRHDELGKGTLYISLCKKLNEGMLALIPSLDIRESPLGISRDPQGIRVTESGIPNSSIGDHSRSNFVKQEH